MHCTIWGKLGRALQGYTLNHCTKFAPNPTSTKVNTDELTSQHQTYENDALPTYCFCSFSLSSSQKAEIPPLQQLRGSWEQMTDGLSLLPYPITSALAFFESPSHLLQKVVLLVTRLFISHLGHLMLFFFSIPQSSIFLLTLSPSFCLPCQHLERKQISPQVLSSLNVKFPER